MASKRARKRARQAANRARGSSRITRRQSRGGRRGGRTDASTLATKSIARFYAKKRIDEGLFVGGGIGAVGKAVARSALGRKALTVARQRLSKIPGIGRFAGRTRRAQQPLVYGTRAIAPRSTAQLAVRAAVPVATGAGAAGLAFEAGRNIFDAIPGGVDMARRRFGGRGGRTPARRGGVPFTPGTVVPTDSITHTWVANGVPFAQLADGRVMVRRKNGTIKTFRRPKPIVLGRNPGIRDISRAYKKIDTLLKVMRKHFPAAKTRTQQHSKTHN